MRCKSALHRIREGVFVLAVKAKPCRALRGQDGMSSAGVCMDLIGVAPQCNLISKADDFRQKLPVLIQDA